MENNHIYITIDLKSFYASVECVERQLDPMDTKLVVADASRTEKTICLAVSTSLKSLGISGRARLFEVVQKVREVNTLRKTAVHTGRQEDFVQMDLFTDYEALEKQKQENEARMKKERALQEAVLSVKKVRQKCHLKRHKPGGRRNRHAEKQSDWRTPGIMGKYDDIISLPHHESAKLRIRPTLTNKNIK